VAARLRPPAAAPAPAPVAPASPAPAPATAPVPAPAEPAGDLLQALFPGRSQQTPPEDLRRRVYAAFDSAWPPARLHSTVSAVLGTARDLPLQPAGSKAERTAREVGGIPPSEPTLGVLELDTGPAWVFFGGLGLYWVQKHGTVRVAYREFALRTFRLTAGTLGARPTHVDLGDGQPRLAGTKAEPLVAVLAKLQAQFR